MRLFDVRPAHNTRPMMIAAPTPAQMFTANRKMTNSRKSAASMRMRIVPRIVLGRFTVSRLLI